VINKHVIGLFVILMIDHPVVRLDPKNVRDIIQWVRVLFLFEEGTDNFPFAAPLSGFSRI